MSIPLSQEHERKAGTYHLVRDHGGKRKAGLRLLAPIPRNEIKDLKRIALWLNNARRC